MSDPDPPRRRKRRRAPARPAAEARPRAASRSPGTRQPRQLLAVAAIGMLLGVALTATNGLDAGPGAPLGLLGPWVSVLSMALAIGAAHTLGRTGPDPGIFPSGAADASLASGEPPDPEPGEDAS